MSEVDATIDVLRAAGPSAGQLAAVLTVVKGHCL
jgi:hypothetical protein